MVCLAKGHADITSTLATRVQNRMNFRRKSPFARAHMYHLIFIALAFTAEPAVGRQPDDFELKYLSIEQHRVVVLPPTHLAYQDDLDDAHAIADCIVPFQLRETHLIWSCLSKRSATDCGRRDEDTDLIHHCVKRGEVHATRCEKLTTSGVRSISTFLNPVQLKEDLQTVASRMFGSHESMEQLLRYIDENMSGTTLSKGYVRLVLDTVRDEELMHGMVVYARSSNGNRGIVPRMQESFDGEQPVGVLFAYVSDKVEEYNQVMHVNLIASGKAGVGRAMMAHAEAEVRKRTRDGEGGYLTLTPQAEVVGFYERLGYSRVREVSGCVETLPVLYKWIASNREKDLTPEMWPPLRCDPDF